MQNPLNRTSIQIEWIDRVVKFVEEDNFKIILTMVKPNDRQLSSYREERLRDVNYCFRNTVLKFIKENENEAMISDFVSIELVKRLLSIYQIYRQHNMDTLSANPDVSLEAVKPLIEAVRDLTHAACLSLCSTLRDSVDGKEVEDVVKVEVMATRLWQHSGITEGFMEEVESLVKKQYGEMYVGKSCTPTTFK
jgi:hypothetical protein